MSILLSTLFSVALNILWVSAWVLFGPSMWREALSSARRKDLKSAVLEGLPAIALTFIGLMSFVTLVGTLLIGALVVETGVMP